MYTNIRCKILYYVLNLNKKSSLNLGPSFSIKGAQCFDTVLQIN